MKLLQLKYKMHKLVNLFFYLIIFVVGFLLGLTINSVNAEELNSEKVCIQKGKNLIDKLYYGEFFNINKQEFQTLPLYARTDYIEIKPNVNYIFSHQLGTHNGSVELFDKDFNFIERIVNDTLTTTFSVSNPNGKYIIIAIWNEAGVTIENEAWAQLEQGSISTPFESYYEEVCFDKNDSFYEFSQKIFGEVSEENKFIYDFITFGLVVTCFTLFVLIVGYIFNKFFGG